MSAVTTLPDAPAAHLPATSRAPSRGDALVLVVCLLLAVGLLLVESATMTSRATGDDHSALWKQLSFVVAGAVGAAVTARLPWRIWQLLTIPLLGVTITLLVAVFVPGVGIEVNGARRWMRCAGFSFQPSELAKLTVPLAVALSMVRRAESRREYLQEQAAISQQWNWLQKRLMAVWRLPRRMVEEVADLRLFTLACVPIGLTVIEPDLGTSLFLTGAVMLTLILGGLRVWKLLPAAVALCPALMLAMLLWPYQLRRVIGLISAAGDWREAPYQLKQSLLALGAGGFTGTGLGRGSLKLSFLPEANNDFIFSVLGEETGLLGTLTVAALWLTLLVLGWRRISQNRNGAFATLVATVMLVEIVAQAALNVAVVTAMAPPKGISHPLLSQGGSNLIVTLLALGMIYSLTASPAEAHRSRLDGDDS